ncbi:hypothetical protein SAMN05216567_118158 [Variovorax sp. OK605]|uniref:hypothetical protein n=1 Tax=Variovorax sp. OK605 TaxID=1855317 RepID=UPI0008DFD5C5|nr:hypothetical protein [Variovorax sp. OK605]SFQ53467.1 hypothetical protein SAMN05216567_118158 [Variovorax sp. OK605]
MNPIFFYCKSWFAAKRYAPEMWTEEQASTAHASGKNYGVLVSSDVRPSHVLTIGAKFVAVDFLDENLREALSYSFQEIAPNQFFLTMAVHRSYEGESDKVFSGSCYTFKPDGNVRMWREHFIPRYSREDAKAQADVSGNYAVAPTFGRYEEYLTRERIAALH